jgi:hypothetical protein
MAVDLSFSEKDDSTRSTTPTTARGDVASRADSAVSPQDFRHLIGRWVRTDGGYVIEIRNIDARGNVDAGYYNPRAINVSRANASKLGADSKVFIELRDTGYPGSTYTLIYDTDKDLLPGVYYQAAQGQKYNVVFLRMK